jgi:cystathionine beta-lyase family protein involved in aluminum resistance
VLDAECTFCNCKVYSACLCAGLYLAPAVLAEALKGAAFLQTACAAQGWPMHTQGGCVRVPYSSAHVPTEAHARMLLTAVQAHACLGTSSELERAESGGFSVLSAGADFVQGAGAEPHGYAVPGLNASWHVVLSGGAHWTQWVDVLAATLSRLERVDSPNRSRS